MVYQKCLNISALDWLADGHRVCPSTDSYNGTIIAVSQWYHYKIANSLSNNLYFKVLHFALSIILELAIFKVYGVAVVIPVVNSGFVNSCIHVMCSVPNKYDKKLLMLTGC
jgi:hypothetical protein